MGALRDGTWLDSGTRAPRRGRVPYRFGASRSWGLFATAHGTLDCDGAARSAPTFRQVYDRRPAGLARPRRRGLRLAGHYAMQQDSHGCEDGRLLWLALSAAVPAGRRRARAPALSPRPVRVPGRDAGAAGGGLPSASRRAATAGSLGARRSPATLDQRHARPHGFITAALLGGGLLLLDRRPLLAERCSAASLTSRNSLLILPLLLAVTRHWRAISPRRAIHRSR